MYDPQKMRKRVRENVPAQQSMKNRIVCGSNDEKYSLTESCVWQISK